MIERKEKMSIKIDRKMPSKRPANDQKEHKVPKAIRVE
jgi:hypothetical protein